MISTPEVRYSMLPIKLLVFFQSIGVWRSRTGKLLLGHPSDTVLPSACHLPLIIVLTFCLAVRLLREELGLLQQPGSYVAEVVRVMGSKRVLVKVHPEGKYGTKAPI